MNKNKEHELSDEELARKSFENVGYFASLIERYERRLFVYITRISSFSRAEAEEILQEVFLKAWKNLNDFDVGLKFSSWIYRIAHNETISSFRKHQSRGQDKQLSLDTDLFDNASKELEISEIVDRTMRAKVVSELLDDLPAQYREVLVLKYFEDRSYEEMSDILKKPMGTIATLVNRAKKAFHDLYTTKNITL